MSGSPAASIRTDMSRDENAETEEAPDQCEGGPLSSPIARSSLHRYGVFALEDIPRGRRVHRIHRQTPDDRSGNQDRPPERRVHRGHQFAVVRGRPPGGSGAELIEPLVPAQFAAAVHARPSAVFQPAEDTRRPGTDLEIPLRGQNAARAVPCELAGAAALSGSL